MIGFDASQGISTDQLETGQVAYAKLVTKDKKFYMNELEVYLGRDDK